MRMEAPKARRGKVLAPKIEFEKTNPFSAGAGFGVDGRIAGIEIVGSTRAHVIGKNKAILPKGLIGILKRKCSAVIDRLVCKLLKVLDQLGDTGYRRWRATGQAPKLADTDPVALM